MTFEEQLIRSLDGNASPIEEEELMSQMAVSPEKRELWHMHLRLRETLARDAVGLRPSRKLRDGTIALLLTTAGMNAADVARGNLVRGRSATAARAGLATAAALAGAVATYFVMSAAAHVPANGTYRTEGTNVPVRVVHDTIAVAAPLPPSAAPQTTRIVHDAMLVHDTVRIASAPVVVHDTVVVSLPAAKMVPVMPTVTIQRDTVYITPKK